MHSSRPPPVALHRRRDTCPVTTCPGDTPVSPWPHPAPRSRERDPMLRSVAAVAALSALAAAASGQIRITEAMSSSQVTPDWVELTNLGASAVDISGWRLDDSSFSTAVSVALNGITTIAPGESVVFIESAAGAGIADFRAFWGDLASVQIGFYSGSGVGLSSGGDAVVIFDGSNTEINRVTFGAASGGISFGYNPLTATFGDLSEVGLFGARVSAGSTPIANFASPGAIPTPAAAGLLGLAGLVAGRRRR